LSCCTGGTPAPLPAGRRRSYPDPPLPAPAGYYASDADKKPVSSVPAEPDAGSQSAADD